MLIVAKDTHCGAFILLTAPRAQSSTRSGFLMRVGHADFFHRLMDTDVREATDWAIWFLFFGLSQLVDEKEYCRTDSPKT